MNSDDSTDESEEDKHADTQSEHDEEPIDPIPEFFRTPDRSWVPPAYPSGDEDDEDDDIGTAGGDPLFQGDDGDVKMSSDLDSGPRDIDLGSDWDPVELELSGNDDDGDADHGRDRRESSDPDVKDDEEDEEEVSQNNWHSVSCQFFYGFLQGAKILHRAGMVSVAITAIKMIQMRVTPERTVI
jgi:hypothetical protein